MGIIELEQEKKVILKDSSYSILTPADILTLCQTKASCLLTDFGEYHIVVKGVLGDIKPSPYNKYYLSLKGANSDSISIEVPKNLLADKTAYQHKEVIVTGNLKCKLYNNALSFYTDVTSIEPVTELSEEVKEQEATLMEFIKAHQKEIKPFPTLETYKITVIHGIGSEVKADFENQTKDLQEIVIEYKPVNITSSDAIKSLLPDIQTDILVIIRGGGTHNQFDVFNNYELLKAWLSNTAYKISALGHTEHRTLMDFFSHASCDTPTACGKYIKDNIELLKAKAEKEKLLKEQKRMLENIKKEKEDTFKEHQKKIEELIKEKDKSIQELNEKIQKDTERLAKEKEELINQKNKEFEEKSKDLNDRIEKLQKEILDANKQSSEKLLQSERRIAEITSQYEREKQLLKDQIVELAQKQKKPVSYNRWLIPAFIIIVIIIIILIALFKR